MYFIDVQGTLIDDKNKLPIKGSIEFIEKLNSENIPYMVITNNTKKTSKEFLYFLQNLGFNISNKRYLDPFMILDKVIDNRSIAPFGTDDFKNIIEGMGYTIDYIKPKNVVISINNEYDSNDFSRMIELILNGADIIAMHDTSIYVKNNKRYPGVGAICNMLSFATNKSYKIVGKPSKLFFDTAKDMIGIKEYKDITIISDDMIGDIRGAMQLGMRGYLVLSGKIKSKEEILPTLKQNEIPHKIVNEIYDLLIL